MDFLQVLFLLLAGFAAGVINAVAGGGMLLVMPVLIASGLTPITANITSNLVLGPGAAGATWQYRTELGRMPRKYFFLLIPCFAGALLGIVALQHTSSTVFDHLVPWLMLMGVSFFVLQPHLGKYLQKPINKRPHVSFMLIGGLLLITSVYGGYFGAGFGFILMAFLGFTNLTNVYQVSALKNIIGGGMEIMGVIYFAFAGGIAWRTGLIAMAGCVAGGIIGARSALRLPQVVVRTVIITIGVIFIGIVFSKAYL